MDQAPHRAYARPIQIRSACLDDVDGITSLLQAASKVGLARATNADEVRDRLNTPNTTRERDTAVALDDKGVVLGFGHVWPAQPDEIRCFGRTHPDHRGCGIGTSIQRALIARAGERAAETPDQELVNLTSATAHRDTEGEALMDALGYAPVRYFQKMVMNFADRPPARMPEPPGITLREVTSGDEAALFAAFVESFAEHWGEEHPDEATWWHERRDADSASYDPSLWLIAVQGDEVAGFALARIHTDEGGAEHGYIGDLGVRPGWRGRGLGECLLTRSIDLLHRRGLPYVVLDVDTENTTGAVRLYMKAGMESRPSFTIWSRVVRQAAPDDR